MIPAPADQAKNTNAAAAETEPSSPTSRGNQHTLTLQAMLREALSTMRLEAAAAKRAGGRKCLRVQEAIALVFREFAELQTVRQAMRVDVQCAFTITRLALLTLDC